MAKIQYGVNQTSVNVVLFFHSFFFFIPSFFHFFIYSFFIFIMFFHFFYFFHFFFFSFFSFSFFSTSQGKHNLTGKRGWVGFEQFVDEINSNM